MTVQQLKYIITVAEVGSITEAARQLFISQPSLSGAIKDVENEAKLTIFNRCRAGVALTPEGMEFVGYARQVVENTSFQSTVLLTQLLYDVYAELFLHIITHFKSNDLTVEAIKDRRNIELSISTLNLSNISKQLLQGGSSSEISFDEILSVLGFSISFCDTVRSAPSVDKPGFAHSAVYCSQAYMSATLCKSCLHPS